MTVRVTADDIKRGRPELAARCPVARALRRATGRDWEVYPFYAVDRRRRRTVELPERIGNWIAAFDLGETVTPTSFDLAV